MPVEAPEDRGTAEDATLPEDGPAERVVVLQLGDDVATVVAAWSSESLRPASDDPLLAVGSEQTAPPLGPGSVVLSVGDTALARLLVAGGKLAARPPGLLVVRTGRLGEVVLVAARGVAEWRESAGHPNLGLIYAAYTALQEVGFGFLHPVAPTIPDDLLRPAPPVSRVQSPRWPEGGLQLHTMRPPELADLVNGWVPGLAADAAGRPAMLPD